jgi:hypothetical protein
MDATPFGRGGGRHSGEATLKPPFVLTLLFLAILSPATRSEAGSLPEIYVAKNATHYRIELLPDGTYYSVSPHESSGTYKKASHTLTCIDKLNGDKTEFALQGESLVDTLGHQWVRRETLLKFPWKDAVPVSVMVVDDKTRAPITEFAYTYGISTPTATFDPLLVRPIEVRSPKGTFSLLAPKSCQIELHLEGGLIIGGYPWEKEYALTAGMKDRKIEAPVTTGVLVEGVVVDARTKAPVAGALVLPIVFTPPLFTPDRNRSVKTDAQGRFKIRGIDPVWGINVWHTDYVEFNPRGFAGVGQKATEKTYTARVELLSGDTIAGTVKEDSGKPLADVEVSDGAGKSVRTRRDGSYSLRGPSIWGGNQDYYLSFEKDGYLTKVLRPKPPVRSPLSIVLEQQPALTGKAVGPDGRPVAPFTVVAGPGPEPRVWCCSSQTITKAGGQFSVRVRTDKDSGQEGKVWMAIQSPGFAMWEAVADSWRGTKAITVQLKAGVSVRGSIEATKNSGKISGQNVAELLPVRLHKEDLYYSGQNSKRQELGRMQAPVDDRGAFRFDHVPPGSYVLAVSGPAISPLSTGLTVGDADVDFAKLTATGRGTIEGIVNNPNKRDRWAFAQGYVSFSDNSGRSNAAEFAHLNPLPFKTDENGRFRLDNVPVGEVSVHIPFHATADIISAHTRKARVFEGQTTEVRFFDPHGDTGPGDPVSPSETPTVWIDPGQNAAPGSSFPASMILIIVAICCVAMAICLRLARRRKNEAQGGGGGAG